MRDVSKELFLFLTLFQEKLEKTSNDYYKEHIYPILEEDSFSFGFKPFANVREYILKEIVILYENEEIIYEFMLNQEPMSITLNTNDNKKEITISNNENLWDFLNIGVNKTNKTEELFLVLENVVKQLGGIESDMGEKLKHLLTFSRDDTARYSFYPAFELINFILDWVDKYLIRIENEWTLLSEAEIDEICTQYGGLFYLYTREYDFNLQGKTFNKKTFDGNTEKITFHSENKHFYDLLETLG
jgi:hypothetical protein